MLLSTSNSQKTQGKGKLGDKDGWSVLGTAQQESRAASTPWSMPPKGKGLANRLLHHSMPQFPHHHKQDSAAERLQEPAACLQFQHWQSSDVLKQLTGLAGRVVLSPSAGSDQELLQPGSPKAATATGHPPAPHQKDVHPPPEGKGSLEPPPALEARRASGISLRN